MSIENWLNIWGFSFLTVLTLAVALLTSPILLFFVSFKSFSLVFCISAVIYNIAYLVLQLAQWKIEDKRS